MELKNVKIKSIGSIQEFGANNFKVVKFVVVDDSNADYPQTLELQATQDKAENLIKYNKVDDRVDVSFNLRGREWINPQGEAKYFNSIQGWRIENLSSAPAQDLPPADQFQPAPDLSTDEPDDLPF